MPCWGVEEAMRADRQLAVYTQQKAPHHTHSHCAHNSPEIELEVNYLAAGRQELGKLGNTFTVEREPGDQEC